MKKIIQNLLLLLVGSVLLAAGWAPFNFFIGPMIGLVPLLFLEHRLQKNRSSKLVIWLYAYWFFASWNFFTIWWVQYASWVGVIASVIVNSLFYASFFVLFSSVKKYLRPKIAYLSLILLWISWEYVELLDWDLSWPWMTLGFSLAGHPWLIQWYEYTGSLGGSFWIVGINIFIWLCFKAFKENKALFNYHLRWLGVIFIIPILISLVIFGTYTVPEKKGEFVVVQPNIDPYSQKFITSSGKQQALTAMQQLQIMKNLTEEVSTPKTEFVLFPETAVPKSLWGDDLEYANELNVLKHWSDKNNFALITGIYYAENVDITKYSSLPSDVKKNILTGAHYRRYNSAILIDDREVKDLYHKSRLVIGVERIPSYFIFLQRYLKKLDDDQNASEFNPNNGVQENRDVFFNADSSIGVAPIICYESIFGEYVGEYVKNGANVLGVITNDAWWGDTPGYKQHFSYSVLRAIETRRSVVRSANTGWSGFISPKGTIIQKSKWWEPTALIEEVPINNEITFYTKYGDVLGRLAIPISLVFLVNAFIRKTKNNSPLGKIS